jgi:hypothetical protein
MKSGRPPSRNLPERAFVVGGELALPDLVRGVGRQQHRGKSFRHDFRLLDFVFVSLDMGQGELAHDRALDVFINSLQALFFST